MIFFLLSALIITGSFSIQALPEDSFLSRISDRFYRKRSKTFSSSLSPSKDLSSAPIRKRSTSRDEIYLTSVDKKKRAVSMRNLKEMGVEKKDKKKSENNTEIDEEKVRIIFKRKNRKGEKRSPHVWKYRLPEVPPNVPSLDLSQLKSYCREEEYHSAASTRVRTQNFRIEFNTQLCKLNQLEDRKFEKKELDAIEMKVSSASPRLWPTPHSSFTFS